MMNNHIYNLNYISTIEIKCQNNEKLIKFLTKVVTDCRIYQNQEKEPHKKEDVACNAIKIK